MVLNPYLKYLLLLVSLFWTASAVAQQEPEDISTDSVPEPVVDTLVSIIDSVENDTIVFPEWLAPRTVKYTIGRDPVNTYPLDTGMDDRHIYDPVQLADFHFRNLGNIGQPAIPITYSPHTKFGFDRGHHQFDVYLRSPERIRWYDSKQAFTRLFLLIGQQREQGASVIHNQTIKQVFNFTFRFNRIASEGSYTNQTSNINDVGVTGRYRTKNYRYGAEALFLIKRVSVGSNGGVSDVNIFEDTSIITSAIVGINLPAAETSIKENNIHLKQTINFGEKVEYQLNDSTRGSVFYNELQLYHEIGYQFYHYRFFDDSPNIDLYGPAFFTADSVKLSFRDRTWVNRAGASFAKVLRADSTEAEYRNFYMDATIVHEVHLMEQVLNRGLEVQNLNLEAEVRDNVQSNNPFRYGFSAKLGIGGYNAGDQEFKGRAGYNFGRFGLLQGAAEFYNNKPDWFTTNMVFSDTAIYSNFNRTQKFSAGFDYVNTKWHLGLSGRYNVINQPVFFDEEGLPQQTNNTVSFYTFTWRQSIRFWDMGLDNMIRLYVPVANTNIVRFPRYWGRQSLFYQRSLFKEALKFRVGLDVFYNTDYAPYQYLPYIGQFVPQYQQRLVYYPRMDVFVNIQIAEAILFFKMEHVNQGMFSKNGYFNAYPYPALGRAFKFGLIWRFYN